MDESRYQPVIAIPNGARALCLKKAQVEVVLAGGSFTRLTNKPLTELVGEAFLLFTGAKAYYHGGGWWQFSGYHYAGKDVKDVLVALGY